MLEKKMDTLKLGIIGSFVFLIGLIVIIFRKLIVVNGIKIGGCIFLLMSLLSFLKDRHKKMAWVEFMIGLINLFVPDIPVFIFVFSFCLAFLIHAFAHGVTAVLDFRNYDYTWLKESLLCLYYVFFAIIILLNPLKYTTGILLLVGIYLCLYGICDLKEALLEHFKIYFKFKKRRKVRIQLPALLAMLIPTRVLQDINAYFEDHDQTILSDLKYDQEPDLEVLIHMAPSGYSAMGHVDICYHGYVITYGNYDASTYRMMDAIGEGVLMVVDKKEYIPFCKKDSNKTLVGFGLNLSFEQKRAIRKRIYEIFQDLEEWECNYKKAEKINDQKTMEKSLKYYANRIYKATQARMYKFKRGKFKTYFVLTTNCVLLADKILAKAGVDLIGSHGIITPGTYYDYLNRQFTKRKSHVISRTVYQ